MKVDESRLYTHRCVECADYRNENTEMTYLEGEGFICHGCLRDRQRRN